MRGVKLPLLPPRFSLHSLLEATVPHVESQVQNSDYQDKDNTTVLDERQNLVEG